MTSFITILKKELLEIYRSKKLLILIVIFAFISVSSPILAKLIPTLVKTMPQTPGIVISFPDPTWKDAIDQLVKNTAQFGFLVLIFMFSGSISEEKNKKTLEMVLTKPISRTSFVLSKFLASSLALKLVYIIFIAVFYFYTQSIFGGFDIINFFWLSLFLLVYLFFILAISLFFSTLFYNQVLAAGTSLIVSIAFTSIIGYIERISKYSPSYILSNYKDLMINGKVSDFVPSLIFSACLIIALIVGAVLAFKNQEIER